MSTNCLITPRMIAKELMMGQELFGWGPSHATFEHDVAALQLSLDAYRVYYLDALEWEPAAWPDAFEDGWTKAILVSNGAATACRSRRDSWADKYTIDVWRKPAQVMAFPEPVMLRWAEI